MSLADPIADGLTRLRNASAAKKEKVDLPASRLMERLLEILKTEGFITNHKLMKDSPQGTLRVYLRYFDNRVSAITQIRRISKPGLRRYATKGQVPPVLGGLGIAILSTTKGLLADRDAKKAGVGGEVICHVW